MRAAVGPREQDRQHADRGAAQAERIGVAASARGRRRSSRRSCRRDRRARRARPRRSIGSAAPCPFGHQCCSIACGDLGGLARDRARSGGPSRPAARGTRRPRAIARSALHSAAAAQRRRRCRRAPRDDRAMPRGPSAPIVFAASPSLAWNTTASSFSFHSSKRASCSSAKKNFASDRRDASTRLVALADDRRILDDRRHHRREPIGELAGASSIAK